MYKSFRPVGLRTPLADRLPCLARRTLGPPTPAWISLKLCEGLTPALSRLLTLRGPLLPPPGKPQ